MTDLEQLRYPVGPFQHNSTPLDAPERAALVTILETAPATIRSLVSGLTGAELETPYRPGGWTIRQVIHHLPDSHMHAYVRMKLAVTEDMPAIKTYDEQRWAELPDAASAPIGMSLDLLDTLHQRWVAFLRAIPEGDMQKAYVHPEWGRVTLDGCLRMYSWHCLHHTAHIKLGIRAAA